MHGPNPGARNNMYINIIHKNGSSIILVSITAIPRDIYPTSLGGGGGGQSAFIKSQLALLFFYVGKMHYAHPARCCVLGSVELLAGPT